MLFDANKLEDLMTMERGLQADEILIAGQS